LFNAGLVAVLFGPANDCQTMNEDGQTDGITNINDTPTTDTLGGCNACNTHASIVSDDDGGYLRLFIGQYYGNCGAVSFDAPGPSQPAGSTVSLRATATGCDAPQYEFWIRFLNGKWYVKQPYSINPIFDWDSSGFPPGVYYVVVHVKQSGHTAAYEAYASARVTLTGCTGATLGQQSSTSHAGTDVTFPASSSGCPDPVYRFWIRDIHGTWHLMQTASSNTWTWHNAGWGKGTYRIVVWVNENNSYMGRPQTYAFKDHVLN